MSVEEQLGAWFGALSVLDQQLLRDHALDPAPPDKVVELLRYSPVRGQVSASGEVANSIYPQPLLDLLGVTPDLDHPV